MDNLSPKDRGLLRITLPAVLDRASRTEGLQGAEPFLADWQFLIQWSRDLSFCSSSMIPPSLRNAVSSPLSVCASFLGAVVFQGLSSAHGFVANKAPGTPVSYYGEIRPIFQANCQGCHQPAKLKGGYSMTDFQKLLAGGEKDGVAIVPGDVSKGSLLEQITPQNGAAEMPKNKPPLAEHEIALIRRWITEGAKDDTPADAKRHYDAEHPPRYEHLPVVSSIDYSPDGSLLAVAGFHEVLLHQADGKGLKARLVGLSERIQSVRFSPDGKWLAAAGGDPARLGEVQVWEVASNSLKVSVPAGWDTLYGISWSPDSKLVAFGCADNTVRAIEAQTGKQVFQMGSHNDWVLDTAFSEKGDHIVSVGRDMTAKLSELAGERFVDNITSITPGALRGGMHAVERHPSSDSIVVGGADGAPQLFRIFRTTARKIGDNANLLKKYPEMNGRIFSTRFSKQGDFFVAGSALDGRGEVAVFSTEGSLSVPPEIAAISAKPVRDQSPEEKEKLKGFEANVGKQLFSLKLDKSPVYAVAFQPDGAAVAVGGGDGKIRVLDSRTGASRAEFDSVPLSGQSNKSVSKAAKGGLRLQQRPVEGAEVLPQGRKLLSIEVLPSKVEISRRNDYVQLLISAKYEGGESADITRSAKVELSAPVADVTSTGQLHPKADGTSEVRVSFGGLTQSVPVLVSGAQAAFESDFVRDVNPVMTKLGCNQGTCHGAKDGKAGFKLSLRGYDPEYDLRSLTDDMASRRVTIASPDDSLMLLKAVAEVPHEGGRRMLTDEKYYHILREWIAGGAALKKDAPRVTRIELFPKNPVVQRTGSRQQLRVVAYYADGASRDVSNEAFVESGNTDVSTVDASGLITTLRRGEAPMLARYEGNYAATTVTVMGDRSGFEWKPPVTWGRIDELVAAKWQRMQIEPSGLSNDGEFLRRVYLDLTGLPPSAEKLRAFVADTRETRIKREEVIDALVGSPDFVEHWTNKWSDLLQVNSKFLGKEGAEGFRAWIRSNIEKNTPYDQFARAILTASGSNKDNPPASYWKILRQPAEAMENTTHLFLATRFNCNKCHDHPFERWTQDQYYQTAAYFAQVSLVEDPASGGRKLGGTAVEGAKPLFEIVKENPAGQIKHDRTSKVTPPEFPYPAKVEVSEKSTRREQLAHWMTAGDNRYFASSYVNRIWGYLLGRGIIEPLDDIRAGNPPSNPELLEKLTQDFVRGGFNTQEIFRAICKSRTYQLSVSTNKWNEDDTVNYSHAVARRLSAETLFDSVFAVTGSQPALPGGGGIKRAAQMVDSSSEGAGGFLATLGKPSRESTCECERSSDLRLGSVMALLSGATVSGAIQDPKNELAKLVLREKDDAKLVNELFQRVLSREATPKEQEATKNVMSQIETDHKAVIAAWEAKEKEQAPLIAKMEKDRLDSIASAKAALERYELETKSLREERESFRKEREARAGVALKGWEAGLAERLAGWAAIRQPEKEPVQWSLLTPQSVSAAGQVKLEIQKDGSVISSGAQTRGDYNIIFTAPLKGVTGFLLEVLPDPSFPTYGPGRSKDGNFILSEVAVKYTDAAKPAGEKVAVFSKAWASHEQPKFPVASAIDGKEDDGQNGWAIAGGAGRRQVAAFQFKEVLNTESPQKVTLRLAQKSADGLLIGRFRVYVTTATDPLHEGVPSAVTEALAKPPAERTPAQIAFLTEYIRSVNPEYWRLHREATDSKVALAPDPRHIEMKTNLEKVSVPIRLDPVLVQLRIDAESSKRQISDKRLTVVQDLTWALINNPAFLFNR
jgi:WD40 repeat protein